MKTLYNGLKTTAHAVVSIAPYVLGGISAYCLFLIVAPFFLLGVSTAPEADVFLGGVNYIDQVGVAAWLGALLVLHLGRMTSILWLIALVNLMLTRRWWVIVVLALAPLPILYLYSGPFAEVMLDWISPD